MQPTESKATACAGSRRWMQYRLRTLLLIMLLASIGMSCFAVKLQRARQRRAAVEAIEQLGGHVIYDYHVVSWSEFPDFSAPPSGPAWLRRLLGDDFFNSVVYVDLSYPQTTDTTLQHLKGLRKLRGLGLACTSVTDAGLQALRGLTELRALSLQNTGITDAGLEHLEGLTQLQDLVLGKTRVTDAGLEHLKGLTQLQDLVLGKTRVTDAGLEHLEELKQLRWLSLDGTGITDAGLEHLQGLADLDNLDLDGTRVTEDGARKLRQALPHCEVIK